MVLLRRCAAGLLCAAGSLGLVSTIQATPVQPIRLTAAVRPTAGQLRLEAMKVEMAWLADVATYGLPLEVHVDGEGLRAGGRVPDEAARQKVLQVARQACCVPVADGLNASRSEGAAPGGSRALEVAARSALRHQLADGAAGLEISADDQGVVTLRGEVATVEDKLAASRCLKGLTGCTAVHNSLAVTPLRHAGHTVTLVTRDGQHAVHGAVQGGEGTPAPLALPAGPELTEPAPRSAQPAPVPYVLPPAPSTTLPSGLPTARPRGLTIRGSHPQDVRPIRYISPSGYATAGAESQGYPGLEGKTQGTHLQVVQAQARPSLWERLTSFTRSRREPEVVTTTRAPEKDTSVVIPVSAKPATPGSALPPAAPAGQPAVWPKAHATAPVTADPVATRPVSRPLSNLIRVQSKPAATAAPAPAAAPVVTPTPAPVQTLPAPLAPQLTPVVMKAETPAVRPVTTKGDKAGAMAPEEIMKLVQDHCGGLAREVRVEVYPEGQTVVKVFAPSANEGPLVGRLLSLPAMGPGVKVQVVLGR